MNTPTLSITNKCKDESYWIWAISPELDWQLVQKCSSAAEVLDYLGDNLGDNFPRETVEWNISIK